MEQIKQIPDSFVGRGEVRGFNFTKLASYNEGFIYEVSNGDTKYYEVFKERINTRFKNVSYPSSKSFGIWAWWTKTFEEAEERLKSFTPTKK